jgi:hypothetical protein
MVIQVAVGLAVFALAVLSPDLSSKRRPNGSVSSMLLTLVEAAVRFGLALGGFYYTLGSSPRAAALAGGVAGGLFTLTFVILVGYVYRFHRSYWLFMSAWRAAGLSRMHAHLWFLRVGPLREAQTRSQIAKRLRQEWEGQGAARTTAEDFLHTHMAEIEERLNETHLGP